MCKKLKERFQNEIIKFKKEFNLEPNLFKIGYGVFHVLNTLDCDKFFTPQRTFKGDSFVMGIKLEVVEPIDINNVEINPCLHKERGYTEVYNELGEIIDIIPIK